MARKGFVISRSRVKSPPAPKDRVVTPANSRAPYTHSPRTDRVRGGRPHDAGLVQLHGATLPRLAGLLGQAGCRRANSPTNLREIMNSVPTPWSAVELD